MSKFKIKHPRYVLVGADYSQLEVKTAVFTSKDTQMKQAYLEGKDLYSLIASMAYKMPYEDCLEFYPEGTKIELEGKEIVCGSDKEILFEYDSALGGFRVPYYYLYETSNNPTLVSELVAATELNVGEINLDTNEFEVLDSILVQSISREDDYVVIKCPATSHRLKAKSPEKVTNKQGKARRSASKSLLIGSIYQRGLPSIADQLKISLDDAKKLMNSFYSGFPTMTKWMEDCKQFCTIHGYVENAVGRRRRLPDAQLPQYSINVIESKKEEDFNPLLECKNRDNSTLLDKYKMKLSTIKSRRDYETLQEQAREEGVELTNNNGKIQQALRQSVNAPCQSLGADVAKRLMLKVDQDELLNNLGFRLLIQVHDEVIGECPDQNAEKVAKRLVELMSLAPEEMGIDIPMKSDAYIVHNWYEDELLTSIRDYVMKNSNKSHQELLEALCKEHDELLPEQIDKVLKDSKAALFD